MKTICLRNVLSSKLHLWYDSNSAVPVYFYSSLNIAREHRYLTENRRCKPKRLYLISWITSCWTPTYRLPSCWSRNRRCSGRSFRIPWGHYGSHTSTERAIFSLKCQTADLWLKVVVALSINSIDPVAQRSEGANLLFFTNRNLCVNSSQIICRFRQLIMSPRNCYPRYFGENDILLLFCNCMVKHHWVQAVGLIETHLWKLGIYRDTCLNFQGAWWTTLIEVSCCYADSWRWV